MPSVACPFCGRKIEFGLHELELVIECAKCEGRFTPSGGPVRPPSSTSSPAAGFEPPPVRESSHGKVDRRLGMLEEVSGYPGAATGRQEWASFGDSRSSSFLS